VPDYLYLYPRPSLCPSLVHQYLKYLESYRAPAADMLFYQRPADLGHRYNSRQQELVMAYQLTHTHLDPPCPDTAPPEPPGHAHHDTPRQAGGHGDLQAVARIPAPALPPKRKQLVRRRIDVTNILIGRMTPEY
jgi:hypothetical protein